MARKSSVALNTDFPAPPIQLHELVAKFAKAAICRTSQSHGSEIFHSKMYFIYIRAYLPLTIYLAVSNCNPFLNP